MRKIMFAAALAAAAASTPAFAQVNLDTSNGLVDVTIQNVDILNNFLNGDQIAALSNVDVPITVQIPVGLAANVCGVNANVLAHQKNAGGATCEATSGSSALARAVSDQILNQ